MGVNPRFARRNYRYYFLAELLHRRIEPLN